MVRLIHWSNESGSVEGLVFTEDMDVDCMELVPVGKGITKADVMDTKLAVTLPGEFPLDYTLIKQTL